MVFIIDEKYLTTVSIRREYIDQDPARELVYRLKYGKPIVMLSSEDHPEFTKLRNRLEIEGFIKTERSWINGDTVLKPFLLNGKKFKKNDRFVSAAAMKHHLGSKFKNNLELG